MYRTIKGMDEWEYEEYQFEEIILVILILVVILFIRRNIAIEIRQ